MKGIRKLLFLMIAVFSLLAAAGCSSKKELTIDLNQYAGIEEKGYDTVGSCKGKFDYNKLLRDNEEAVGSENVPALQRLFRKIDLTADKTTNLKNGDTVTLSWGTVDTQTFLNEYGITLTYSDGVTATVDELQELKEVDIFDYIKLKQEGYSLIGRCSTYITYEYTTERIDDLLPFLKFELDKDCDLSNGDEVVVSVSCNNSTENVDEFAASLGKKLKSKEKKYTIDSLWQCEVYDPFENLEYSLVGMNGYGFLANWECYNYLSSDSFVIEPEKTEGFSNGDELVFSLKSKDSVDDMDKALALMGLSVPNKEVRIPVEGLRDGLSDISQLSPETLERLISEDISYTQYCVSNNYYEADIMREMLYIGSAIGVDKNNPDVDNKFFNIYKCDFVSTYDDPYFIYLYCERDNVYVNEDGSLDAHEFYSPFDTNYWADDDEYFVGANGYSYYGFDSLDKMNEAKLAELNMVFNNVQDVAMEHHIIIPEVYAYASYSDDSFNASYDGAETVAASAPLLTGEGEYTIKIAAKDMTYRVPAFNPNGISNLEITLTNGIELFDKLHLQVTDVKIKCDSDSVPVDLSRVIFKPKNETDYMLVIYSVYSGQPKDMSAVNNELINFTKSMKITLVVEKE
ncbi:MAG: hypothetical protein MJ131_02220 [Lachnospiraceae bacterium]|nr:hypothetical protein [Lachnospiraceae bacterium]